MTKYLRIDASARTEGSVTRMLLDEIVSQLGAESITRRDLAQSALPQITDTWVSSNFTPADQRDAQQQAALAQSDALVAELQDADVILIGAPIYNFAVPAALKAWIDLVARAGVTFRYSETGPVGLLEGKLAIVAMASGGTPVGSDIDFASGYLRHVLGFLGIHDVTFVTADALGAGADEKIASAKGEIQKLAA